MHIDEEIIKELVFNNSGFSEAENESIKMHLNSCIQCNEVYETNRTIISQLNEEFNSNPTELDIELAKKIAPKLAEEKKKLLPENRSFVKIYDGNYEIIRSPKFSYLEQIVNFIKYNPLKTASSLVTTAILISLIFILPARQTKESNPAFAQIKDLKLRIYNKYSELLWEKTSFGLPDRIIDTSSLFGKNYVSIEDLDGDGINEVLVSGQSAYEGFFRCDSVYCFNNDGNLRWVAGGEAQNNNKAPEWRNTGRAISFCFSVKYGNKRKVFLTGHDRIYGGAFVSEINPLTGKVLSTLYHSGWISHYLCIDLDNDGNEEIILSGTSSYDKPSLLILKTDDVHGVMPDLFSKNKKYEKGSAYAYILLYSRNLNKFDKDFFAGTNTLGVGRMEGNGFSTQTAEVMDVARIKMANAPDEIGGIIYNFDSKLKITHVSAGSVYTQKYNLLLDAGLVKQKLDTDYFKILSDSIKYWDGDNFVYTPVRNKYYNPKLP